MDFQKTNPLPFFMLHPEYIGTGTEKKAMKDFDYFQQTFPSKVKEYQQRIASIIDHMDYEGAMIYDEYPDRLGLETLASTITDMLLKEEQKEQQATCPVTQREDKKMMIQVLVCNEIYRRRHNGKREFFYY